MASALRASTTAVLPPIVCRYPFANDEIAAFCDDIERELGAKARDLSLTPLRMMREFLAPATSGGAAAA